MGYVHKQTATDWWRIGKLVAAIGVSAAVGYWFQPLVAKNKDAVNTVVTIFSILAGFLIAVITLIAQAEALQVATELEASLDAVRGAQHRAATRVTVEFKTARVFCQRVRRAQPRRARQCAQFKNVFHGDSINR